MGFAHMTCDADTHLRTILFCQPIFVGFGAQDADRNTAFFQLTKRYIELYKKICKPVLSGSAIVYHHTPEIGLFRPANWCVLEYGVKDSSTGYAGIFKIGNERQNTGGAEFVFKPRGLNVSAEYDVCFDNCQVTARMSGSRLALDGIPVRLEGAMTSELLIFTKVV
jgi:alpha-galactosidase